MAIAFKDATDGTWLMEEVPAAARCADCWAGCTWFASSCCGWGGSCSTTGGERAPAEDPAGESSVFDTLLPVTSAGEAVAVMVTDGAPGDSLPLAAMEVVKTVGTADAARMLGGTALTCGSGTASCTVVGEGPG